jgi:acyl-homoserine-lactone acylase
VEGRRAGRATGHLPGAPAAEPGAQDFVQNSNDPAWMANPAQPLTGYSPLVSRNDQPLGMRGRFALQRLQGKAKLGVDELQRMVTDDEVYLASLVLPDLLQWCKGAARMCRPCAAAWRPGMARPTSTVALAWCTSRTCSMPGRAPGKLAVAFDPADPQHTPAAWRSSRRRWANWYIRQHWRRSSRW